MMHFEAFSQKGTENTSKSIRFSTVPRRHFVMCKNLSIPWGIARFGLPGIQFCGAASTTESVCGKLAKMLGPRKCV